MNQHPRQGKTALNFLIGYAVVSSVAILFLLYTTYVDRVKAPESTGIIRAKGIVIEDAHGNDRILIGAPVPYSNNRVRTDTTRVKKAWGDLFPPQYMEYYKGYNHTNVGMLILDEKGFDRIALGDPVPDPNIGKRIGPSTGMVINDSIGFERTGYGILNVAGKHRVTLGLDNDNGTEGISITIMEDGSSGISMKGEKHRIFLGKTDSIGWFTNNVLPMKGLYIDGKAEKEIILNASGPEKNN